MATPNPQPNPALYFERRITKLVEEYGSLGEASKHLKIPISTLSRYCSGERLPDYLNLWRLGDIGIDLNWLVTGRRRGK